MNKGRSILYIAIPVCAGLFCLLGWNAVSLYHFEKKHIEETVNSSVKNAADTIQNYNGSLESTYAAMLTDDNYDRKVAFAAGFTHNMGKVMIPIEDAPADTTLVKKPAATPRGFILTPKYFREHHITYDASRVMTVRHFDSVFQQQLVAASITIPYTIVKIAHYDSSGKDTIMSPPFILEFAKPVIWSVHYRVPSGLVLRRISPYLLAAALLCLLLPLATIYLYRSYRLQAQMSQFRESLLGNITHELKTPLSSLQLIIERAGKELSGKNEVQLSAAHIAYAATELKRMTLLIERILSYSRLNHQQLVLSQQHIAVSSIMNDALVMMDMKIQQAGVNIQVHGHADLNIFCDPLLLTNAIAALIDNAIKYADDKPVIVITIKHSAQQCMIDISDNGIGIQPQLRHKIFDPFFRIQAGNVHNIAGHGLGLSFVKQVAELHGGSIGFSGKAQGTTFTLQLPCI